MKNNKKPFYKRIWFIVVIVIVLIIGCTALTMPFTYGVQNIILKTACRVSDELSEPDNYASICENTMVASNITYTSSYNNNQMDIIIPKVITNDLPLLVYFHGGYYVGGDKASAVPYCRIIANENYIVANVNYEFAPEEKYPAQLIQANEAIAFLTENSGIYHINADKIFIGGDSAGAHLTGMLGAFYTNLEFKNKIDIVPAINSQQLKGVVLNCGFYNAFTIRDTKFPFVNDAMWMFTGVKKYENFERIDELNTINNVTTNYPATFLLCGSDDPFYNQNLEMQTKLEEYNIDTTAYLPVSSNYKLKHEFQRKFSLAEANIAIDLLIDFLADKE